MLLEDLIAKDFTVVGDRRYARTVEHDSLIIDREKEVFYWNSKGLFGNAYIWLTKVKHVNPSEAYRIVKKSSLSYPITRQLYVRDREDVIRDESLVGSFYKYGKNYKEYWYDVRGYTDETIDKFKLGYTGEWHVVPIFIDGEFVNFQCRKTNPRRIRLWYKEPNRYLTFNFSILPVTQTVVIAESPVDAIMLRQNNIPSVSQLHGAGTWRPEWVADFILLKQIYIVYDNDQPGNIYSRQVAKCFGDRAKIYNMWDFKHKYDITDFFKDGHTREQFISLLENRSKYYYELEDI